VEPWSFDLQGRFEEHTLSSEALQGNPLGDPTERPLWVYLPPGYDDDPDARFASVYAIQGLTGQLDMWRNRSPFRRNFPELADDLFARGEAPPVIVVWVDCWTSLGGSQFLDSPGTGKYLTYLCDEVVPFVDEVERRLWRHGRADAPAGPLGRAGDTRRRCALRDVLPAGVPRDRPDAA